MAMPTISIMPSLAAIIAMVLTPLLVPIRAQAEDPTGDDDRSLYIESKTRVVSPQCLIDGASEVEDRQRDDIGIGEVVELTLNGKFLPDVDFSSIKWAVDPEESGTIVRSPDKPKTFLLTVNPALKKDTAVNVLVTTNVNDKPKKKPFNIIVPSDIKAEHSGQRLEDHPGDGQKDQPGASSKLVLCFHPLKVSFSNVPIIERAEDPKDFEPKHIPGKSLMWPNARNEFRHDNIGWKYEAPLAELQEEKYPASFTWACGWYVRANDRDCCKIHNDTYPQTFHFDYGGVETENAATKGLKNIVVKVEKFERPVTRSTAGEAKHVNGPDKKQ